jgi:hypothetical protein
MCISVSRPWGPAFNRSIRISPLTVLQCTVCHWNKNGWPIASTSADKPSSFLPHPTLFPSARRSNSSIDKRECLRSRPNRNDTAVHRYDCIAPPCVLNLQQLARTFYRWTSREAIRRKSTYRSTQGPDACQIASPNRLLSGPNKRTTRSTLEIATPNDKLSSSS